MTNTQQIAQTIYEQLGGRRFTLMTGAKNLTSSAIGGGRASLSFQLPNARNARGQAVNRVVVILAPSDTYTIQTYYFRGMSLRPVDEVHDVYCDTLQSVFTSLTGLHTRL